MYYLPFHCLSFLALPVLAVCVCQWLTGVLCCGPTSGTAVPHKRASSFNRYRQGALIACSNLRVFILFNPLLHIPIYVNPTAFSPSHLILHSSSHFLTSLLSAFFILILAALLWCFSVSNNGEYGSLCGGFYFLFPLQTVYSSAILQISSHPAACSASALRTEGQNASTRAVYFSL